MASRCKDCGEWWGAYRGVRLPRGRGGDAPAAGERTVTMPRTGLGEETMEPPTDAEIDEMLRKLDAGEPWNERDALVASWATGWEAMASEYEDTGECAP